MRYGYWLLALAMVFALTGTAVAQDDTEAMGSSGTIPEGDWLFLVRAGGGNSAVGGGFKFADPPADFDDEAAFTSAQEGIMSESSGGLDAMWLPFDHGLLFSLSAFRSMAVTNIEYDDEEDLGGAVLEGRALHYDMSAFLLGIGYRFLYGSNDQFATNLHLKIGGASSGAYVDGVIAAKGGGAVGEFGANFVRRFEDGMNIGVQFDLRGYALAYEGVDVRGVDTDADLGIAGGAGIWSLVIGWEI